MRKKISDSNKLLIIGTDKSVIEKFMGPFFTAYFVSSSINSLPLLSVHYLFYYFAAALPVWFVGRFMNGKKRKIAFCVGVCTEFLVSLTVVLMGKEILNHVVLFGFFRGISAQVYWFPFNYFKIDSVKDNDRQHFESVRSALEKICEILLPIVFAGIITATSFTRTAIITLFLSGVSVAYAFTLKEPEETLVFNPREVLKIMKDNDTVKRYVLSDFLCGFFQGGVGILLPAFFMLHNNSNIGLGLVISISSGLFIVLQLVIRKFSGNDSSKLPWVWVVLGLVSAIAYVLFRSFITIAVFYGMYLICYGFINIFQNAHYFRLFHKYETIYPLMETALGLGRVTAYALIIVFANYWIDGLPLLITLYIATFIPFVKLIKNKLNIV